MSWEFMVALDKLDVTWKGAAQAAVLQFIANRADFETGRTDGLKLEFIGRRCGGMSRAAVSRALAALIHIGLIENVTGRKGRQENVWRPTWEPIESRRNSVRNATFDTPTARNSASNSADFETLKSGKGSTGINREGKRANARPHPVKASLSRPPRQRGRVSPQAAFMRFMES